MENDQLSTYDKCMLDPKRRQKFEEDYQKLVLVEILMPLLEKSEMPVRILAKEAGISPTIIQDIKSGKKEGISYATFLSILEALGYRANIRVTKVRKIKPKPILRKKVRNRRKKIFRTVKK